MRSFNLDQMRTFSMVCRLGGVHKAAKRLKLTQPAITARIRKLEDTLNVELFDRLASGLQLTRRGEILLEYAEQFELLIDRVEEATMTTPIADRRLRIGATEWIASDWLIDFLSALDRLQPQLSVEVDVDVSSNLRAALLNRDVDLAVLLDPMTEPAVETLRLPELETAWFAAADLNAAGGDDRLLLQEKPIIGCARDTRFHRDLKREAFARVGETTKFHASTSPAACFHLVEAGIGVAPLPLRYGRGRLESGAVRVFDPGWRPENWSHTISYLTEPKRKAVREAAQLAKTIAETQQRH